PCPLLPSCFQSTRSVRRLERSSAGAPPSWRSDGFLRAGALATDRWLRTAVHGSVLTDPWLRIRALADFPVATTGPPSAKPPSLGGAPGLPAGAPRPAELVAKSAEKEPRSHHLDDRVAQRAHVRLGHARHVDAPGAHDVDRVLVPQPLHLGLREPGEAEHPLLVDDEGEVAGRAPSREGLHEELAHAVDAIAHPRHLVDPALPQLRVREDGGHDGAAVGGRVRVVGPGAGLQLAEDGGDLLGALALHGEGARALVVEAEILREARADQELVDRVHQRAHADGVLVDAATEALVGEVHQGQGAALSEQRSELLPLLGSGIDARRVVTAGVQQDGVPGAHGRQTFHHGLEGEAVLGGVEVGVRPALEPGCLEDLAVVVPGGIAEPDLRAGVLLAQVVRRQAQGARTAGGVAGGRQIAGGELAAGPEEELADAAPVGGVTGDRLVALGLLRREQAPLRLLDDLEDGGRSRSVLVDADGQVDLVRSLVAQESLGQAENRVGGGGGDGLEHGGLPLSQAPPPRKRSPWISTPPAGPEPIPEDRPNRPKAPGRAGTGEEAAATRVRADRQRLGAQGETPRAVSLALAPTKAGTPR